MLKLIIYFLVFFISMFLVLIAFKAVNRGIKAKNKIKRN